MTVDPPAVDPDSNLSPWEGMSGAAVFVDGRLIAVVNEHHGREGLNRLSAFPVSRWYELLDSADVALLGELTGLPGAVADLDTVHGTVSPAVAHGQAVQSSGGTWEAMDPGRAAAALARMGPEQRVEVLKTASQRGAIELLTQMGAALSTEVLVLMDSASASVLLDGMDSSLVVQVFNRIQPEPAASLLALLRPIHATEILASINIHHAAKILERIEPILVGDLLARSVQARANEMLKLMDVDRVGVLLRCIPGLIFLVMGDPYPPWFVEALNRVDPYTLGMILELANRPLELVHQLDRELVINALMHLMDSGYGDRVVKIGGELAILASFRKLGQSWLL